MSLKEKLQVMVVDDMSVSRGLLVNGLEGLGIKRVVYENDGAAALKSLSTNPAHVVISDFNMPNMDGLELLKNLRANKATQKVGFILVTGSEDKQVLVDGKKYGMNNYLKKPFDSDGLRKCIEAVVGPIG